MAIGLTIALAIFILSALTLMLYGSQIALLVARWLYFGDAFTQVWKIVQWFFVLGFVLLAFTSLYLFAPPNLKDVKLRWLTPGSLLAVVLWLAEGRVLCFILALYGFAVFGYVTATIATFCVGRDAESDDAELAGAKSVEALREEIAALRKDVQGLLRLSDESSG